MTNTNSSTPELSNLGPKNEYINSTMDNISKKQIDNKINIRKIDHKTNI